MGFLDGILGGILGGGGGGGATTYTNANPNAFEETLKKLFPQGLPGVTGPAAAPTAGSGVDPTAAPAPAADPAAVSAMDAQASMPAPAAPAAVPAAGGQFLSPEVLGIARPKKGGIVSSALGLDPDTTQRVRSSLGAALTAVGNSAGKSPMQALAAGAGGGFTGAAKSEQVADADWNKRAGLGQTVANQGTQNTLKLLDSATKIKGQEETANYRDRVAKVYEKNADTRANKPSSWNKPTTQLTLDAEKRVENYQKQHPANATLKSPLASPDQKSQAQQQLEADTAKYRGELYKRLGLPGDGNKAIGDQANPYRPMTQDDFNSVQPGQWFVNPRDGRLLQRKPDGATAPSTPQMTSPEIEPE